jgi:hypothetical protein
VRGDQGLSLGSTRHAAAAVRGDAIIGMFLDGVSIFLIFLPLLYP